MNKRILISFSGGKTSAYMTWCLLKKYDAIWSDEHKMFLGIQRFDNMVFTVEILVVFANTSKENNETLDFVRDCDINFGFHTIWIEAKVNENSGEGTSYILTNYELAKRDGSVFEAVIKKYGIPNMATPHCTRELKAVPITKLVRDYGWDNGTYETAIGFRVDEPKRFNTPDKIESAKNKNHTYFFVHEQPTNKLQVNSWWAKQSFNLNLKDHEGNCDLCYKKSENKLMAIVGCCPDKAKWWEEMENKYKNFSPESRLENAKPPYYFYRKHTPIKKILTNANEWFKDANGDDTAMEIYEQALINGYNPKQLHLCNESCEPFLI
jgi:3'-phosphoadenosine 5'-phosphosulfate sulfotransferase (PAPS reductase)/FAD synthetase